MESLEKEFLKLKIEVEKKENQLKIEETKTALVKTDLELKMEHYENLKIQKAILIQKRNVEKKAHEMEIFLKNMPASKAEKERLKPEDKKTSVKLSKIEEIKKGGGLVGTKAVSSSGAMSDAKLAQDSSEQNISGREIKTPLGQTTDHKSNLSQAGEAQNCALGDVSEAEKQVNFVKGCFKKNISSENKYGVKEKDMVNIDDHVEPSKGNKFIIEDQFGVNTETTAAFLDLRPVFALEHIDDLDGLMHVALSLPQVLSLSWSSHGHEARLLSKFLHAAGLTAVQESSASGVLWLLFVSGQLEAALQQHCQGDSRSLASILEPGVLPEPRIKVEPDFLNGNYSLVVKGKTEEDIKEKFRNYGARSVKKGKNIKYPGEFRVSFNKLQDLLCCFCSQELKQAHKEMVVNYSDISYVLHPPIVPNYYKGSICLTENNLLSLTFLGEGLRHKKFARQLSKFIRSSGIKKLDYDINGDILVSFKSKMDCDEILHNLLDNSCNSLAKAVHCPRRCTLVNTNCKLSCYPLEFDPKDFKKFSDHELFVFNGSIVEVTGKKVMMDILTDPEMSTKYDEIFITNSTFRFKDSLRNMGSGKEEKVEKEGGSEQKQEEQAVYSEEKEKVLVGKTFETQEDEGAKITLKEKGQKGSNKQTQEYREEYMVHTLSKQADQRVDSGLNKEDHKMNKKQIEENLKALDELKLEVVVLNCEQERGKQGAISKQKHIYSEKNGDQTQDGYTNKCDQKQKQDKEKVNGGLNLEEDQEVER